MTPTPGRAYSVEVYMDNMLFVILAACFHLVAAFTFSNAPLLVEVAQRLADLKEAKATVSRAYETLRKLPQSDFRLPEL